MLGMQRTVQLPPAELRARRLGLGLTQAGLASSLGVTANTVARWERGEQRIINPERLRALLARLERNAGRRLRVRARIPDTAQVVAPDAPGDPVPHNIPLQLSSFVGRARELSELEKLLGTTRLMTVVGTGGIGKTRLALQVAAGLVPQYRDGVWFVDLGAIEDPVLVAQAVAVVLGVREEPGQPLVNRLRRAVGQQHTLLVLDNCEHLLSASAELVETLLRSSPNMRVLATSREPLRIAGETAWRVTPLALPPSGQRSGSELERCRGSVTLY